MRTLSRLIVLPAAIAAIVFATGLHSGGVAEAHDYKHHVVQRSDTLYSIARMHGSTVDALVKANNIANPNLIYVGQKLVIPRHHDPAPTPPPTHGPPTYTVQHGDTLFSIAAKHGTTVDALVRSNHIINPNMIVVGQRLVLPEAGHHEPAPPPRHEPGHYTVKPGDTLTAIAAKHGTTVHKLVKANHIANPNLIHAGQVLKIK